MLPTKGRIQAMDGVGGGAWCAADVELNLVHLAGNIIPRDGK